MEGFEERRKPVNTIGGLIAGALILFLLFIFIVPLLRCEGPPPRRTKCISNLKQIGLALIQYSNDNKEVMAFAEKFEPYQAFGKLHPSYASALEIFRCPGSKDKKWNPTDAHEQNNKDNAPFKKDACAISLSYAYGINKGKPWTAKDPSSVRIAADKYATQDYTKGDNSNKPSNHQAEGRNVVCLDGSAQWDNSKGLLEADPNTEYENSRNPEHDQTGADWWSDPPDKR